MESEFVYWYISLAVLIIEIKNKSNLAYWYIDWEALNVIKVRGGIEMKDIIFCRDICALGRCDDNCSWRDGDGNLSCEMYLKTISSIKNLLDTEAKKDTMAIHPRERLFQAVVAGDAIIAGTGEGEVVGFVYLIPWKNHVEIAGLVIRENYRGFGVGGKLFSRAIELAGNKYPQQQVIFFANDVSEKIGRKYDFWSAPCLLTDPEFSELCKDCKKEYKKPRGCRCRAMILVG